MEAARGAAHPGAPAKTRPVLSEFRHLPEHAEPVELFRLIRLYRGNPVLGLLLQYPVFMLR
jgi:hypothetical protein